MQKLLGRIRKQQDEWSKRAAPTKPIGSEAVVDETRLSPVQTEVQGEIGKCLKISLFIPGKLLAAKIVHMLHKE